MNISINELYRQISNIENKKTHNEDLAFHYLHSQEKPPLWFYPYTADYIVL